MNTKFTSTIILIFFYFVSFTVLKYLVTAAAFTDVTLVLKDGQPPAAHSLS